MVKDVERKLQSIGVKEVSSRTIGEMMMDVLRRKDKIAYIRFASVYREFKDVEEFVAELRETDPANKQFPLWKEEKHENIFYKFSTN